MTKVNRRTVLKAACALPIAGSLPGFVFTKENEPIILHYLFCEPVISGEWLEVESWRPWVSELPRRVEGFARRGRAFLKKEFAGYYSKDLRFEVETPPWGEVIFEERWWNSSNLCCKHDNCACHSLERPSPFPEHRKYEHQIIEYTDKTQFAPRIGWEGFASKGYDNLWPVNYKRCQVCDKTASVFFHVGERKTGFYCMKCQLE